MSESDPAPEPTGMEVAILSMVCRLPGAKNSDEYWRVLRDGVETISFFSPEELRAANPKKAALLERAWRHPDFVPAEAVVEGIDRFDAGFFGYSARDAELIDPQQRFFLECSWHALEQAGYDALHYAGLIGVFGGSTLSGYLTQNLLPHRKTMQTVGSYQTGLGNANDHLVTRVAYKLNLEGPAVAVLSACSTSLVAVHLACQSLIAGECDMALAGGASLSPIQKLGYVYQPDGIASRDGHCRSYDAEASGTVGGNGVGVVLLKRLEDALADGDPIDAVIRGSAINNDGSRKVGYTAPRIEGQANVIRAAQQVADVHPDTIGYIEGHGTATSLGDPIEVAALTRVFQEQTARRGYCALGSAKSNFGHLDAAAGVAGLMKAALSVKHGMIPPSLHYRTPNPKIDFEGSPFFVNTELRPWPEDGPRRAGVSSFGIGGTNAHAVLEEPPESEPRKASGETQLLVFSAKTPTALDQVVHDFADHREANPDENLDDIAFTLAVGRRMMPHRRMILAKDSGDLVRELRSDSSSRILVGSGDVADRGFAFLFSGQGAQTVGMGQHSYQRFPVFREALDECANLLEPHLAADLRDVLFASDDENNRQQLQQTRWAQPALFAIEYSLARWWMSLGIVPEAMIGHSIGEYVAATLAGVFSLEDALGLVAARGALMQSLPAGRMVAVPLPEADCQELTSERVSIAAVNAPSLCVMSGDTEAIAHLESQLTARGIDSHSLHTSHAFHSAMMEPILEEFGTRVESVSRNAPEQRFLSNVTGTWIRDEEARASDYWCRHLRATVHFSRCVSNLLQDNETILLEVGPGNTLASLAQQHFQGPSGPRPLASWPGPKDSTPDDEFLLNTVGRIWLTGHRPGWESLFAEGSRRVRLPVYPFERQRYWIEPDASPSSEASSGSDSLPVSRQSDVEQWFSRPTWKQTVIHEPRIDVEGTHWLVFREETSPMVSSVVQTLRDQGAEVREILPGTKCDLSGPGPWTVRPGNERDHDQALRAAQESPGSLQGILHAWLADVTSEDPTDQVLQRGFSSLVGIGKSLAGFPSSKPLPPLIVLGRDLFPVLGTEPVVPTALTAIGPCKVMPQELPALRCRLIDHSSEAAPAPELLFNELRAHEGAPMVALRGRSRFTPALESQPLHGSEPSLPSRKGGTYLITGGLGGIGHALAQSLAEHGQPNLVLVTRRALPPESEWDSLLAGSRDRQATKIQRVLDLRKRGATVTVEATDVSDSLAMKALVDRCREKFGPIHGVVHAAGVAGGGMIALKTEQAIREVLAPKVQGTLALDNALGPEPLDYFVLCSSLASFVGGVGQVDYVAANGFLDGFAAARHRADRPVLSLNWATWKDVGLAVEAELPPELEAQRQEQLRLAIAPNEGVRAFELALQAGGPQLLISPTRVSVPGKPHSPITDSAESDQHGSTSSPSSEQLHARPNLPHPYVEARSDTERKLVTIWQELLGISPIGIQDPFMELGGHSLLATRLLSRVRDEYGASLGLADFFENPTIEHMAKHIEDSSTPTDEARDEVEL